MPLLTFAVSSRRDSDRIAQVLERRRREGATIPWYRFAEAVVRGDFVGAAELSANVGDATGEAYARLRAARQLVEEGRRPEADQQLQKALAFFRSVGATRYIREGESLLAASA